MNELDKIIKEEIIKMYLTKKSLEFARKIVKEKEDKEKENND